MKTKEQAEKEYRGITITNVDKQKQCDIHIVMRC